MKKTNLSNHTARSSKYYNFFGDYLNFKFGCRVLKIPINAGLTCPNRIGPERNGGCIFCSAGSASTHSSAGVDVKVQMETAKKAFKRADIATKYIAYFQAYSNTYGDILHLKYLYDLSIEADDVIGLMIGTRPDCLDDQVLDLIASYMHDGFELWLEVGMQSCHERSLKFLQRHHSHEATRMSVRKALLRNIPVCVHIIIGIPGETWNDIMETAYEINRLGVSGVKIHHLHVIRNTMLDEFYQSGSFQTLTLREYISTLCDFLERLNPEIIIHRVTGDREQSTLIAPKWGLHKGTVIKAIDDEFSRRGTLQGFLFQ